MVEETLVKESLTEQMIDEGQTLLAYLNEENADIVAAYWIYLPSVASWELHFVSPKIDTEGSLKYYTKIRNYLSHVNNPMPWWLVNSIKFVGTNYSFFRLLRKAIDDFDIKESSFLRRVFVADEFVDIYIYRFANLQ